MISHMTSHMTHTGPPDSMREHVVAAAHAMLKGDWKKCRDYILSIKALDLFLNVDQLKEMLTRYVHVVLHEKLHIFGSQFHNKHSIGPPLVPWPVRHSTPYHLEIP